MIFFLWKTFPWRTKPCHPLFTFSCSGFSRFASDSMAYQLAGAISLSPPPFQGIFGRKEAKDKCSASEASLWALLNEDWLQAECGEFST